MRTIAELLASPTPQCLEDAAWLTGYTAARHIPPDAFRRILFEDSVRAISPLSNALTPQRLAALLDLCDETCDKTFSTQVGPYWEALWIADPTLTEPGWQPTLDVVHPWEQACAVFWAGYGYGRSFR